MKILFVFLGLILSINIKAQTQEEVAAAQKEYMQQMSQLMNCDSLKKTLDMQLKSVDSTQLSKEQWAEVKKSINSQIDLCKEYGAMFGGGAKQTKETYEPATKNQTIKIPNAKKSDLGILEMPSAYKITYVIKEGQDLTKFDMYLSDNSANYGVVTKDPETGENVYSAYKEATKTMYMVAKGFVMKYDFSEFQKSGQSITPSPQELTKYSLKPTGATKNIAGYLCKELIGKTDEGSILRIWIAYGIKSGSNIVPGVRYVANEKALYQKTFGSGELGFFLEASTTDKEGTTTISATSVMKGPAKVTIDTTDYQMITSSELFNYLNPKN